MIVKSVWITQPVATIVAELGAATVLEGILLLPGGREAVAHPIPGEAMYLIPLQLPPSITLPLAIPK